MRETQSCRRHPRAKAGWHCATCQADLCPDCVATLAVGHRQAPMDVCCQCRRGVAPLTIHRAEAIPFWQRVLDAPKYPLGQVGLLSLVGFGFVRALTSYVGLSSMMMMGAGVFLLRHGLFWAFLFFIIRNSAEGATKMGVLGLRDIQNDVVTPAIKGMLSTALVWLPAAIYIYVVSDEGILGILSYEGHKDPIVWLLALAGLVYAPMALLAGATDLGFVHILNPIQIFSFIRRAGRDYFVAVASVTVVLAFGRIVDQFVGGAILSLGIPFLPRWIAETIALYPSFVAARILGVLLFTRGEVLDWGRTEDYLVPVLAGVRPRGVLKEKPAAREQAPEVKPETPARPAKPEPRSIPVFDPQVGPISELGDLGGVAKGSDLALADGPPALMIDPAATSAVATGAAALMDPMIDLPSLPPLGPVVAAREPGALAAHDAQLPPVDLPIAMDALARGPDPIAPAYPTIRGFSPASQPADVQVAQPPRLDLGVTRVGHASPLGKSESVQAAVIAPPPSPPSPIAPLLQAVEEARLDEALRIYRDLPGQDTAIPAKVHMKIGKEAARVRDFDVAAHAFKQVAFTDGEHAGAALVSLAQVMGDGRRDRASAEKLYREAITRFPGSDVAAFAERKLAAGKG
jgi:hypothetical protein